MACLAALAVAAAHTQVRLELAVLAHLGRATLGAMAEQVVKHKVVVVVQGRLVLTQTQH